MYLIFYQIEHYQAVIVDDLEFCQSIDMDIDISLYRQDIYMNTDISLYRQDTFIYNCIFAN